MIRKIFQIYPRSLGFYFNVNVSSKLFRILIFLNFKDTQMFTKDVHQRCSSKIFGLIIKEIMLLKKIFVERR